MVGHLEHAADVGGLALVEEEIGGGGVVVGAVAALEEAEGVEGVEKVACGARMKAEACAEFGLGFGVLGEFGEELEFDGAEQGFAAGMRPARQRDAVVSNFQMVRFVVPGPGAGHTRLGLGRENRGWPGIGEQSDAVLRVP